MELLQKIADELSTLDYVDSICLSGSRTGLINDAQSDFDIYVYSSKPVDFDFRTALANKYAAKFEIKNDFFGDGDEWLLADGRGIDLMYRNTNWLNEEISRVWDKHQAGVGYSTCFLYNIMTSKILFDRNGIFSTNQKRLETPYPQELVSAIVAKNHPLLKSKLCASFYEQIEKAISRNDVISINHRTSAFLASYFDILFAINKVLHPGEKKLVEFAKRMCTILPKDFESDVNSIATSTANKKLQAMDKLLNGLKPLIP